MPHPKICARITAGTLLIGAGVLHAAWAAGSNWPAKDREELSLSVVGNPVFPSQAATMVVAIGAMAVGAVAAGLGGDRRLVVAGRRAAGLGMLARAALGGDEILKVLRLPTADPVFSSLNNRYYRPIFTVLGISLLAGARL